MHRWRPTIAPPSPKPARRQRRKCSRTLRAFCYSSRPFFRVGLHRDVRASDSHIVAERSRAMWRTILITAALLTASGCRNRPTQLDPFLGRTTVPPPPTGSVGVGKTTPPSLVAPPSGSVYAPPGGFVSSNSQPSTSAAPPSFTNSSSTPCALHGLLRLDAFERCRKFHESADQGSRTAAGLAQYERCADVVARQPLHGCIVGRSRHHGPAGF